MLTNNANVIKRKKDDSIVMETNDFELLNRLNTDKYYAVPILEHLQNLNKEKTNANT